MKTILLLLFTALIICESCQTNIKGSWIDVTNRIKMIVDKDYSATHFSIRNDEMKKRPYNLKFIDFQDEKYDIEYHSPNSIMYGKGQVIQDRYLLHYNDKSMKNSSGKIDGFKLFHKEESTYAELESDFLVYDTVYIDSLSHGILAISYPYKRITEDFNKPQVFHIKNNFTKVEHGINPVTSLLNHRIFIDKSSGKVYQQRSILTREEIKQLDGDELIVYNIGFNHYGKLQVDEYFNRSQQGEHEYFYFGTAREFLNQ